MTERKFKFAAGAGLETIPQIIDFIVECLRSLGLDEYIFAFETSVDEACTNVIQYAYQGKAGHMTISCRLEGDDFSVTIRDHGIPFDPASVASPDLNAELDDRKIGGLGLHLMNKMMDQVSYGRTVQGENVLILKKRVMRRKSDK